MEEGELIELEQVFTAESEVVYCYNCELCRDDGINVKAEGFCADCEEYLCITCFQAHRKSRPTRHHELLDEDAMPKDTPFSHDRVSKDISTTCKLHSGKPIDFYCTSHDTLGCSTCYMSSHRHCRDIESVYDKSKNFIDCYEYRDLVSNLNYMERKSREMILKTRENVSITEKNCSEAKHELRKLRKQYYALIDELWRDLIETLESLTSEEERKMKQLEKKLLTFAQEVDQLKTDVEVLTKSKRDRQLYIHTKTKKSDIAILKGKLRKVERDIDARMFKFESNDEMRNVIKANGLGNIVVQDRSSEEAETPLSEDNQYTRDITAEHVFDIDISSTNDSRYYSLIGSAVMSDTKLVVTDFANNKVKLLDTATHKLISEVGNLDYPFDVAVINERQAAVSFYDSKKIMLLSVTDNLRVATEIFIEGECRGIAYSQNKLFITFCDKPHLEIMDLQGNVINTIDKNTDGSKLFREPMHICVSKNGESVYVSDSKADKVLCLTLDGVLKSVYSELSDPQKACTDHRGYVYIAGSYSKTVHMLTADCTKIKEILTLADGLDRRVLSVSHCQRTDRLYVGMKGSKLIKVFQLENTQITPGNVHSKKI